MSIDLINLFVVIVIFGVLLWVINAFIPMAPVIKSLLNILAVIVIVVYVLQFFGVISTILPMIKILH